MARRLSKVITGAAKNSMGGEFNHDVARGLAHLESKQMMGLLDKILKSAFSDPSLGLVYVDYKRPPPEESAEEIHRVSSSGGFDISASDLHVVKYVFKYGMLLDKTTERYRWMPFIRPGNLIMLGGSSYLTKPVVTDKIISPGPENTFIRLLRTKISISKINYACTVNGFRTLDLSVPLMSIFNKKPKDKATNCKSTLLLHLLGQYGLTGMFKKFGFKDVVITSQDGIQTVDLNQYLAYTTGALAGKSMTANNLVLLAPNADRCRLLDQLMCNTFYLLDNLKLSLDMVDTPGEWQRTLGTILYGDKNDTWLTLNMRRQYETLLTSYMPPVMVEMLRVDFGDLLGPDLQHEGFFKLLILTMMNYDMWLSVANEISASAYDKQYAVNYFLLYDTITKINQISWELFESKVNGGLTDASILKCLRKHFTLRGFYRVTDKSNLSVVSISTHISNYVYRSVNASLQLNANGATGAQKKAKGPPIDPTTLLHETHLIAGTMSAIGASKMSPLSTINIFAPIDRASMTIIPTDVDLCHLESIREVLSKSPHRSQIGEMPEIFNRYVKYPANPPPNW
jgi:hypothetical protein